MLKTQTEIKAFRRQNKLPHPATFQGRDYRLNMNSSRSNTQAESFLVRKIEMYLSLICGCSLLIPIVCYSLISEAVCAY